MQVTVGNQLRIENPSEQLLTWCKKQLILPNPEYAKKVRMHFWVGNTPEKLYLFQWDGDTLVLPYPAASRTGYAFAKGTATPKAQCQNPLHGRGHTGDF